MHIFIHISSLFLCRSSCIYVCIGKVKERKRERAEGKKSEYLTCIYCFHVQHFPLLTLGGMKKNSTSSCRSWQRGLTRRAITFFATHTSKMTKYIEFERHTHRQGITSYCIRERELHKKKGEKKNVSACRTKVFLGSRFTDKYSLTPVTFAEYIYLLSIQFKSATPSEESFQSSSTLQFSTCL